MNVHSSITHNSQKVETTQTSINKSMDKQNVAYPHNGFSSIKRNKVLIPATFHLCETSTIGKSTESRLVVASAWGRGKW